MGARTLKTGILGRTPESRGKPGIGLWGRRPRMCNTPARPGKTPPAPKAASRWRQHPRTAREDPDPPESTPPPRPRRELGPARTPQEAAPTTPIPGPVSPSLVRKAQCIESRVVSAGLGESMGA